MRRHRCGVRVVFAVFLAACGVIPVCLVPSAHGGNLEMVEERTDELDRLNRQAVGTVPAAMPREGRIDLTADVFSEEGEARVEVQKYKIHTGEVLHNDQTRSEGRTDAAATSGTDKP